MAWIPEALSPFEARLLLQVVQLEIGPLRDILLTVTAFFRERGCGAAQGGLPL